MYFHSLLKNSCQFYISASGGSITEEWSKKILFIYLFKLVANLRLFHQLLPISSFRIIYMPEAVLEFPDAGDECVKVRRGAVDEAGGHVAVVFGHPVE